MKAMTLFAGCIDNKEANEVMAIIEEGCERIEQNGW